MDEQYVIDLYREILGREPDPVGLAHNLGLLQSGAISASDLAGAFAGSQEAQTSPTASPSAAPSYSPSEPSFLSSEPSISDAQAKAQVADLYKNILGRSPDAGAKGWENLLLSGYDISEVARQIGSSQEAQSKAVANISPELRANDPNNFAGSVTQLYASALGRTPDAATLEANINLLNRDPDAFAWIANSVTTSPEARAYAEKSGVDLNKAYENVIGNFTHFSPTPKQGGLGGLFQTVGPFLPFALAGGALLAPYLAGAGAAGGAAGGAGAAGAAGAGGLEAYMAAAGLNPGTFTGASFALPGALTTGSSVASTKFGLNAGAPTVGAYSPSGAAATQSSLGLGYAPTGLQTSSIGMGGTTGAGSLTGITGSSAAAGLGGANLGYGLTAEQLARYEAAGATGASSLLDSLGSVLRTPLGQLGAMGGLSLLGGGAQQQQPIPQMAGGGGTFAPRGQVDYRPIIDLLAPRQISRTSLLG